MRAALPKCTTTDTAALVDRIHSQIVSPLVDGVTEKNIGQTVRYYRNGWHYGELRNVRLDRIALIAKPNSGFVIPVPLADVEQV